MTARDMAAARQQTRDGASEQTAALRQLTTQRVATERVATERVATELPKADRRTTRDGTVHTVAIEQAAVPVQATAAATTQAATTPATATATTTPAAHPAADPVLELRGAAVRVGGRTLWSGVDLDVRAGEFVAVLGPNGVGKSTLLKVLLGVLPAAEGEARVLGLRPGQGGDRVGYLPQRRSFGPGMRIRGVDLVRLGLDGDRWGLPLPGGRRRREQAERIAEVVELVGAAAYAHRPIGECSGGEQQRLLIAQALVRRPAVLLLDEPLDSLDLPNQSAIAALIGRICHQEGVAVVMVAHDVNPILHHLDRVVYIAGGGAVAGTPGEVVTSENLTRLYGTPVEVLRTADGRLVVVGQPEA